MRKFPEGYIFHIYNKSIANYEIFKDLDNSFRFIQALDYYNNSIVKTNLGNYLKANRDFSPKLLGDKENRLIKFLGYCVMPDHYHLLIKILKEDTLLKYMNDLQNSYTKFFNVKFERKGPLWQNNFQSVLIKTNEQLLHVSRYININPTTSFLVEKPENWIYSSYHDYLNEKILKNYLTEISIKNPATYRKFAEDNIDYQRKLKLIKKLILE